MKRSISNSDKILMASLKAKLAVMLVGEPGTSKTASIKQLAKDMDKFLITIVPSRMDSQDISGFPTKGEYTYTETSSNGDEKSVVMPITEYAPQIWQAKIMREKKVLLFLDEFSNAHPSVRASLLSFIQDREFPNGEKFPEETVIVGAMNPTDSAADGYELDPATTNRVLFLSWKPTVESWLEGMVDNWGQGFTTENEENWRGLIVRFINDEPGALHMRDQEMGDTSAYGVNVNDSSDLAVLQYAWASRRSWDNLSRVLGALDSKDSQIEDIIMAGTVGYKAATRFRDWLRKNGALDIKKIISDPRKFNGWATLTLDDLNLILRSSLDGVDQNTKANKVLNVIDIFTIVNEIDRASVAAPYLVDLAKIKNKAKGLTTKEKEEITEELFKVITLYKAISSRRK